MEPTLLISVNMNIGGGEKIVRKYFLKKLSIRSLSIHATLCEYERRRRRKNVWEFFWETFPIFNVKKHGLLIFIYKSTVSLITGVGLLSYICKCNEA